MRLSWDHGFVSPGARRVQALASTFEKQILSKSSDSENQNDEDEEPNHSHRPSHTIHHSHHVRHHDARSNGRGAMPGRARRSASRSSFW